MTRRRIAIIGGFAIVVVLGWVVASWLIGPTAADEGVVPSPSVTAAPATNPVASAAPSPDPTTEARPTPTPTPVSTATPVPTPAPTEPPPTDAPESTEAAQVSYVRFLARLAEDRSTVADLNQRLADAGEGGDRATARATAVDILRFSDGERDWLAAHPPADCYAPAHAAAGTMLEAYAAVADRAIEWADADGLDTLTALANLVAAGDTARDALADLASAVEGTTCPA